MKFKDFLALFIILAVNCLAAVFLIFFFSMRAPNRPMNFASYFAWGSQPLNLVLITTLLFWLAYFFYFRKKI